MKNTSKGYHAAKEGAPEWRSCCTCGRSFPSRYALKEHNRMFVCIPRGVDAENKGMDAP